MKKANMKIAMAMFLIATLLLVTLAYLPKITQLTGYAAAEQEGKITIQKNKVAEIDLVKYFGEGKTYLATTSKNLTVEVLGDTLMITPDKEFVGERTIKVFVSGAEITEFRLRISVVDTGPSFAETMQEEMKMWEIEKPKQNVTANLTNATQNITSNITNATQNITKQPKKNITEPVRIEGEIKIGEKKIGQKIEDEPDYDVNFTSIEKDNETLMLVFYHNSNKTEPVGVEGNVTYNLSNETAEPFENVSLMITLDDGIIPEFELHIGNTSETFKFGKKIPNVWLEGKPLKKHNKKGNDTMYYQVIDRDDDLVDVLISKEGASVYIKGANTTDIKGLFEWISGTVLTTEMFAAEPIQMEEAIITLPRTDDVTAVVECADFNFTSKTCNGEWLVTGLPYNKTETNVTFTVYHFSGYGGGNIAVINVQSYPTLYGNWTVMFNTTGTANLTIIAVNTTWTDYAESEYDLKFLEIMCGNQTLNYSWINDSVFIPDYHCDELGYETSKVLTEGKHTLKFEFGTDSDYAYNEVFLYAWSQTYNRGSFDFGFGVDTDSFNNVLVTGASTSGGFYGYATIKYNSTGGQQWVKTYDRGANIFARDVAVDQYNDVIVTGQSNTDFFTIVYGDDGSHYWNASYNQGGTEDAYGVAVDGSDNIIVAGVTSTPAARFLTVKYANDGTYLWNRTFVGTQAWDVTTDNLNNILVTGGSNYLTVKYDSNGNHVWNRTYTGTSATAYGVATDSSNNVIVTGVDNSNYRTIKYNSTGSHLWNVTYDSGGADSANDVTTDSANNIIVTGNAGSNIFTIKYDPNGNAIWNATYAGSTGEDVATDTLKNIIVTGTSSQNYLTVKYQLNYPPNLTVNPILNSTDGTNRTSQDLTVYMDITDTNNHPFTNITNWYKNGASYTVLNMPFDMNTSSTAKDYTPYNNTGTISGPIWTASGISGGAYRFDGVDDNVQITDSDSVSLAYPIALEAWINANTDSDYQIFIYKDAEYQFRIDNSGEGSKLACFLYLSGSWEPRLNSLYAFPRNGWHHVVCAWDGSTMRVYVDGALNNTASRTGTIAPTANSAYIGITGTQSINGTVDEVRIYKTNLSDQQVAANYNSGAPKYNNIVSQELSNADAWYVEVTPNDAWEDGIAKMSNGVQVGNAPTQGTPIVNITNSNLTVYPQNVNDIDGNSVINITNWLRNGNSIAVLNMPFDGLTGRHAVADSSTVLAMYLENNAKDFSGNGNDGTITGATYNSSGKVGGAYSFDGVNDYITIPDGDSLNLSSFTVSFWTKIPKEPGNYEHIISKTNGSTGLVILTDASAPRGIYMAIFNTIGGETNTAAYKITPTFNQWKHVTYTSNGTTISTYENSILKGTNAISGTFKDSVNTVMRLGAAAHFSGQYFNGTLDEVHIFNRSLSASEIKDLYRKGLDKNNDSEDYSGFANAGVVNGATWTASGKSGGAYTFDGANDYIGTSYASSMNITGPMTVEVWINTTTLTPLVQYIADRWTYTPGNFRAWSLDLQTTSLVWRASLNGTDGGVKQVVYDYTGKQNQWHHIVGTYNGTNLTLYVDGSQAAIGAGPASIVSSNKDLYIGGGDQGTAYPFNGTMDEVRIYNRSLTAEQIAAHYNAGAPKYSTIVPQEYAGGGTWSAETTPNDGYMDGTTGTSNGVAMVSACGTTITGDATLTSNLTQSGAGNCIDFGTNNIQLDCNGYTITGDLSGGSYGVRVNGRSGLKIKNCKINKFEIGVYATSMTNSIIDNNELNGSSLLGIYVQGSSNDNITNNKVNNTGSYDAITLQFSNDTLIQGNTIYKTGRSGIWIEGPPGYAGAYRNTIKNNVIDQAWGGTGGIGFYNYGSPVDNNIIQNNTVTYIPVTPIYVYSSNYNKFENNIINQSYWNGFYLQNSYGNNVTNTTWDNIAVYSLMLNDQVSWNNTFEGSPVVPRYVYLSGNNGLLQFRDTINLSQRINFATNTSVLQITNNKLFVNTTLWPSFNVTFLGQLAGVYSADRRTVIKKDNGDTGTYTSCVAPSCNISWYSFGRVEWIATGFSNYMLGNNTPPTQGTPILNATTIYNTTQDNLTVYNQSTNDADGHNVTNVINWYRNSTSIMALNMPFDFQSSDLTGNDTAKTYDFSGYNNTGNLTTKNQTLVDSCDTNTSWACYNSPASIVNTTIDKIEGSASLTLIKGDTTNTDFFCQKAIALNLTDKYIGVWVYIKNSTVLSKINRFQIYLPKDGGYSAYGWKDFDVTTTQYIAAGWNLLYFNASQPTGTSGSYDPGQVAYVRLDVDTNNIADTFSSGDILMDYWFYSQTPPDGPDAVAGIQGKAYWFDGKGDYINVKTDASLDFNNTMPMSVEVWVKPGKQVGSARVLSKAQDATTSGYALVVEDSQFVSFFRYANPYWLSSTTQVNLDQWNHLAVAFNGSNATMYINGQNAGSTIYTAGMNSNTTFPLIIGAQTMASGAKSLFFNGTIDEVRLYNISLSSQQIIANYNSGAPRYNLIVAQETGGAGETWKACITPNDGIQNGTTNCSNTLTIGSSAPPTHDTPILNSTFGTNTTTENLTAWPQNVIDIDGNNVTNITNWYVNNNSITILNMPFDTNSNTLARDYSPFGRNGTVNSATWTSSGKSGGAYNFSGVNSYINASSSTNPQSGSMSITMWARLAADPNCDGNNNFRLLVRKSDFTGGLYTGYTVVLEEDRKLTWSVGNGTAGQRLNTNTYNLTVGQWVFLAFTYNYLNNESKIYANGTEMAGTYFSTMGGPVNKTDANTLYISHTGTACPSSGGSFNGTIDEVQIFDRKLSPEQIKGMYNNGVPNHRTIVSQELTKDDVWQACLTPNDGTYDGITKCSNNITILKGYTNCSNATNGILVINSTRTITSDLMCDQIIVNNSAILYVNSTAAGNRSVLIQADTSITVDAGSMISTDGMGYRGGLTNGMGPGGGIGGGSTGAGGGAHGGNGAKGSGATLYGGNWYGSSFQPNTMGSGGGGLSGLSVYGGNGGGAITINTTTLTINGQITADGIKGTAPSASYASGGGAGGAIYIIAYNITGTGTLTANGGNGSNWTTTYGGAGGGGRIIIYYNTTTWTTNDIISNIHAAGGKGTNTTYDGEVGTLAFVDNNDNIMFTTDGFRWQNNDYSTNPTWFTWTNLTTQNAIITTNITNLKINISKNLNNINSIWTFNNSITNSTTIDPDNIYFTNTTMQCANYTFLNAINMTIDENSTINATGTGYSVNTSNYYGLGPGRGIGGGSTGAGGAGHGGSGAKGSGAGLFGGSWYGSSFQPNTMGSAGGGLSNIFLPGGNGGGAITINTTNTLTINGKITADGTAGTAPQASYASGGGAGGTIYITTYNITGTGNITAKGGNATNWTTTYGGAGGGGRIIIYYNTTTWTTSNIISNIHVAGGKGTNTTYDGEVGTLALIDTDGNTMLTTDGFRWQNNDYSTNPTWFTWTNLTTQNAIITTNITNLKINISKNLNNINSIWTFNNSITNSTTIDPDNIYFTNTTMQCANYTFLNAINMTIDENSTINATGTGYSVNTSNYYGLGPGGGLGSSSGGAGGAGHGGSGAKGSGASLFGGSWYGSSFQPNTMGSAGGGLSGLLLLGGNGGGAITINTTNTLTINGKITADGTAGTAPQASYASGGGAGGTIYITTYNITGTGNITAKGGNATNWTTTYGGAGGGGRIIIYYNTTDWAINTFPDKAKIDGGKGSNINYTGQPGTLAFVNIPTDDVFIFDGFRFEQADTTSGDHNHSTFNMTTALVRYNESNVSIYATNAFNLMNSNLTTEGTNQTLTIRAATLKFDENSTINITGRLDLTYSTSFLDVGATYKNLSTLTLENDSNTEVAWLNNTLGLPANTKLNLSTVVTLGYARARVNSSKLSALNKTANITFFGITDPTAIARWDPEDDGSSEVCPAGICTLISFVGTTYKMNVSRFTTYLINNNTAPTHDTPILNSTFGTNTNYEDLTVWPQNVSDYELDPVYNITNWYLNSTSIMVLNLPFDTSSNSTTKDYSFGTSGVTVNGANWTNASISGGGYIFDGINDYIMAPSSGALNLNSTITLEAWFKTNDTSGANNMSIITKYDSVSSGTGYNLFITDNSINPGDVGFTIQGLGGSIAITTSGIDYRDGNWHYVVATYDGAGTAGVVVDNINGASGFNVVGDYSAMATSVFIGSYDQAVSGFFNGTIDEVRIYPRVLSSAQQTADYNGGASFYRKIAAGGELKVGDNWYACVTPTDSKLDGITKCSNNITIVQGYPPSTTQLVLNSTGLNYTRTDTLTCWATGVDNANTTLSAQWQWFKNGVLNRTGSTSIPNGTLSLITTLGPGNLTAADTWTCSVRMSDGYETEMNWNNASQKIGSLCGETLYSNKSYILTINTSMSTSGGTCFNVTGNNAQLDCQGKRISATGAGINNAYAFNTIPLVVNAPNNFTMKNCWVQDFAYGAGNQYFNASTFYNNTFNSTFYDAISLGTTSVNNNITGNNFMNQDSAGFGTIYMSGARNSYIYGNNFTNNTGYDIGFYTSATSGNDVRNNIIDKSNRTTTSTYSIYFDGQAHSATFENNTIINMGICSDCWGYNLGTVPSKALTFIGQNLVNGENVSDCYYYNVNNAIFENFKRNKTNIISTGQLAISTGSNITIRNNTLVNHPNVALNLYTANTVTVANNTLQNVTNLRLYAVSNILIENNSFYATTYGVEAYQSTDYNVTIRNNTFRQYAGTAAVYSRSYPQLFVENNEFFIGDVRGVHELGSGVAASPPIIRNNRFTSNTTNGGYSAIWVYGNSARVYNNTVTGTGGIHAGTGTGSGTGIQVYNNSVRNCAQSGYGIQFGIYGSGYTATNNTVTNCSYGIAVYTPNSNISNNILDNNTIFGIAVSTDTTILSINISHDNLINGREPYYYFKEPGTNLNSVDMNISRGVSSGVVTLVSSPRANIYNCNISSNGSGYSDTPPDISFYNSSNSNVTGNQISGGYYGIELPNVGSADENITIQNNLITDGLTTRIYASQGFIRTNIINNTINLNNNMAVAIYEYYGGNLLNISNNNITARNNGAGFAVGQGSYSTSVSNTTVFNNTISTSGVNSYAVQFYNLASSPISTGNVISYNTFIGGTTGVGISMNSAGGFINNSIHHNIINGSQYGLYYNGAGANNTAYENKIYNTTGSAVYTANANRQNVYNNTICYNKAAFTSAAASYNLTTIGWHNNSFCIVNKYPLNGTTITTPTPLTLFNATNLANSTSTNCTALINGTNYGYNDTMGPDNSIQSVLLSTISTGWLELNYSCINRYDDKAAPNSILFRYRTSALPTVHSIILNSTFGTNTTDENLTLYYNITDAYNDPITNQTKWYRNQRIYPAVLPDLNYTDLLLRLPFENYTQATDTLKDYSPLNNGVTNNGAVWQNSTDRNGYGAYNFTSSYMTTAQIGFNSNFTVITWVKPNTANVGSYVRIAETAYNTHFYLGSNNAGTGYKWIVNNATAPYGVAEGGTVAAGQWQMVAGTYNGTTGILYVDGAAVANDTFPNPGSLTDDVYIGRYYASPGFYWPGLIDDVIIYNKTLTAQQIQDIYNNISTKTILAQETEQDEIWRACVTSSNQYNYTINCSNNLTISPFPPPVVNNVTLNSTYGTNYSDENLTVYYNSTDPVGGSVINITNWYLNGNSIMVLNMPFINGTSNSTFTKDYSPSGNNGTVVSAIYNATGGYDGGGAYDFTGGSKYIGGTGYQITTFTVSAWIKRSAGVSNWEGIAEFSDSSGNRRGIGLDTSGVPGITYGALKYRVSNSSGDIDNGQWHFLAGTYDGSTPKLYLDGQQVSLGAENNAAIGAGNILRIGDLTPIGYYFGGIIDDVRIYNRSLSAEQILALYQNKTDVIVAQETSVGDIWKACITPSAGTREGNASCSNNLTIMGNCGRTITADLALEQNITCNGTAITIGANNITLDCTGYTMKGNLTGYGIEANSKTGLTVKNCRITNFTNAIRIGNSNNALTLNNTAWDNSNYAIYLYAQTNSTIENNTVYNNSNNQITLDVNSHNARIINNNVSGTAPSIYVYSSENITFQNNLANSQSGNSYSVIETKNVSFTNDQVYGATTTGFYIRGNQTTLTNVTSTAAGTDLVIASNWPSYDTQIIDSIINSYSIANATRIEFKNSTFGSINFLPNLAESGSRLFGNTTSDIRITNATVFVNSSAHPGFNVSSNISVYGVTITDPRILEDRNDDGIYERTCRPPICYNLSYSGGIFIFNSTHFTFYNINSSRAPTHNTPILNSTYGRNGTNENLTVYPQNVTDFDGDDVVNITNWYLNGTSITVLNMPFDLNNNTFTKDYSPYGNNGTPGNGVTAQIPVWTNLGISGGAYKFDGINDTIVVPDAASLNITGDITIEFWVNLTSIPATSYALTKQATSINYRVLINSIGQFVYQTSSGGLPASLFSTTNATPGVWYYVVATRNATNMSIYVNGVKENERAVAALNAAAAPLVIGALNVAGGNSLNGTLDEVRIYNRTLTASQILSQYNAGVPNYRRIVSSELRYNETWMACVTPTDGMYDGITKCSNNLTLTDTIPPYIVWDSQIPPDVSSTNVVGTPLNITYNITDIAPGVNNSTVFLYYKTNSTASDCLDYVNGSIGGCGYRNTSYLSAVNDTYKFQLYDNQIYPATYNLPERPLELTPHNVTTLTNPNQDIKIRLFNVSSSSQYGFFEVMANTTGTGLLRIYYCNSSYTSGVIITSNYCTNFYNLPASGTYNHSHSNYSSHQVVPFAINTTSGTLGGIKITSTSYFVLRGIAGTTWNVYYVTNISRPDTIQTSTTNGVAWTNFSGTVDSHLHQYYGNDTLYYYACANDTIGNGNCSAVRYDFLNLTGIPPTAPYVYSPTNDTYYLPVNISINYTAAQSPNGYAISFYNISLLDANYTFNKTIITNNSINLSYLWDTTGVTDGNYVIRVQACDVLNQCSFGYSEMFALSSKKLSITTTYPDINVLNFRLDDQNFNGSFSTLNGIGINSSYDEENTCQLEQEVISGKDIANMTIVLTGTPVNMQKLQLICSMYAYANSTGGSNCTGSNDTDYSCAQWRGGGNIFIINLTNSSSFNTSILLGNITPQTNCSTVVCWLNGTWKPGDDQSFNITKNFTVEDKKDKVNNPNGTLRFTTDKYVGIHTLLSDINILNFQLRWQNFTGIFDTSAGTCIGCTFDLGNGTCQAEVEKIYGMFQTYNMSLELTTPTSLNFSSLNLICRLANDTVAAHSGCANLFTNYGAGIGGCANWAATAGRSTLLPGNTGVVVNLNNFTNINVSIGTISPRDNCKQVACEINGSWRVGDPESFIINKTFTVTAV